MTEGVVVYTVGHGTMSETEMVALLRGADLSQVIDVRTYPGSRHNPQYGQGQLERWLPAAGIGYSWDPRLGGRRRPTPLSRNVALRHESFRAYADHMATPEFRAGLAALIELSVANRVVVMCAESVWWRCHRRLLADSLVLLCSASVWHLFHDGRLAEHHPTPEARVVGDRIIYDLGSTAPLL